MSCIAANWEIVSRKVAAAAGRVGRSSHEITVVAVSKTFGVEAIREALEAGVTHLGENRVQEAEPKIAAISALAYRPTWHLIGHLQSNKAKTAATIFDVIQSVDSLHLAEALSSRADHTLPVLLQVNVAVEETKGGFLLDGCPQEALGDLLMPSIDRIMALEHLKVEGLMTIAPMVPDPEQVRPVFRRLREVRDRLGLSELSMGMSGDYEVAIEEGATIVRVGRAVFGVRTA